MRCPFRSCDLWPDSSEDALNHAGVFQSSLEELEAARRVTPVVRVARQLPAAQRRYHPPDKSLKIVVCRSK
jgi:hypothetical protein